MRFLIHMWGFLGVVYFSPPLLSKKLDEICIKGVYAQAVAYSAPDDWVVVIDGLRFTPKSRSRGAYEIRRVLEDYVEFRIEGRIIGLSAGMSYDLMRNREIVGNCRPPAPTRPLKSR